MPRRLSIFFLALVLVLAGGIPVRGGVAGPTSTPSDGRVWPATIGSVDRASSVSATLWLPGAWHRFVGREVDWQVQRSPHFRLHVLPGTAAARDLPAIAAEAEASLARISARLGLKFHGTMDIYLVERVFWQGGAAYNKFQVLITYSDRNYVDIPLQAYLDHELTHALAQNLHVKDGHWNSLMAEGLAVWATGGHYGPEPVNQMAAALVPMGRYVPIRRLLDDFHGQQHEIAYIEAGSFVSFLIERYGLVTVKRFYSHADRPEEYFGGKSYADLERDWLAWLARHDGRARGAATAAFDKRWWQLQVRYFDVMRDYQERFDPFARTLPQSPADWDGLLQAEYSSDSSNPVNLALESQLQAASQGLYCGNLDGASKRLDEVEASAAVGSVDGIEARQRLAVAKVLAAQDRALRRFDGRAYLRTATPELHARVRAALQRPSSPAGLHQQLARLWVNPSGTTAVAWVSWLPILGDPTDLLATTPAYRLTFQRGAGDRWLMTGFRPLTPSTLIPRNQRLCNPSFAASM